MRTGEAHDQRARVRHGKADVAPQRLVEGLQVALLRRVHLGEHVGMAADRALTEQDQAAGEDVGAFHGDADRDLLVGAAEEVLRAEAMPCCRSRPCRR